MWSEPLIWCLYRERLLINLRAHFACTLIIYPSFAIPHFVFFNGKCGIGDVHVVSPMEPSRCLQELNNMICALWEGDVTIINLQALLVILGKFVAVSQLGWAFGVLQWSYTLRCYLYIHTCGGKCDPEFPKLKWATSNNMKAKHCEQCKKRL